MGDQQKQGHGEDRREDERARHRADVLLEVGGAANLAVQRCAPVRPQVEERDHRDQEQRRPEGEATERARAVVCAFRHRCGVGVLARRSIRFHRVVVERGLELGLRVEDQEPEDDQQAGHPGVEAELLQPRVATHAERDEERGEDRRDHRRDEDAAGLTPEAHEAVPAEDRAERLEELLREDVRVDRHPVPVDEPPPADRKREAEAAADDTADPDVVAARAWHHRDQRGVDDRLEDEVRP